MDSSSAEAPETVKCPNPKCKGGWLISALPIRPSELTNRELQEATCPTCSGDGEVPKYKVMTVDDALSTLAQISCQAYKPDEARRQFQNLAKYIQFQQSTINSLTKELESLKVKKTDLKAMTVDEALLMLGIASGELKSQDEANLASDLLRVRDLILSLEEQAGKLSSKDGDAV